MQQNQPQPEFSQDHIVRRLISKFRKPSDAGAIGLQLMGSSNTLQVPQPSHGPIPTVSGTLASGGSIDQPTPSTSGGEGGTSTGGVGASGGSAGPPTTSGGGSTGLRSLAGKQSRWSQLVASAAAGASGGAKPATATAASAGGSGGAVSSTRSLLDIQSDPHGESSSNRSSADGRDDEMDENYFRPGGKGHQALLDNMDKR